MVTHMANVSRLLGNTNSLPRGILFVSTNIPQLYSRINHQAQAMKFSSFAVASVFLASRAEAFAGPQMKPRFGLQVRCVRHQ